MSLWRQSEFVVADHVFPQRKKKCLINLNRFNWVRTPHRITHVFILNCLYFWYFLLINRSRFRYRLHSDEEIESFNIVNFPLRITRSQAKPVAEGSTEEVKVQYHGILMAYWWCASDHGKTPNRFLQIFFSSAPLYSDNHKTETEYQNQFHSKSRFSTPQRFYLNEPYKHKYVIS